MSQKFPVCLRVDLKDTKAGRLLVLAPQHRAVGDQHRGLRRHAAEHPHPQFVGARLEDVAAGAFAAGEHDPVADAQRVAVGPAGRRRSQVGRQASVAGRLRVSQQRPDQVGFNVEQRGDDAQFVAFSTCHLAVGESCVREREDERAMGRGDHVHVKVVNAGHLFEVRGLIRGQDAVLKHLSELLEVRERTGRGAFIQGVDEREPFDQLDQRLGGTGQTEVQRLDIWTSPGGEDTSARRGGAAVAVGERHSVRIRARGPRHGERIVWYP